MTVGSLQNLTLACLYPYTIRNEYIKKAGSSSVESIIQRLGFDLSVMLVEDWEAYVGAERVGERACSAGGGRQGYYRTTNSFADKQLRPIGIALLGWVVAITS